MNVPTSNHALPTRERSNKRGLDPTCCLCGEATELSQHCMWSCVHAQEIWKQSLHILARSGGYGEVSWVVAQWLIDQESWFPQFNEWGPFMQLEWGTIRSTNSPSWPQTKSTEFKSLWLILVGLTTWQIWKHHCRMIFEGRPISPAKLIMELWDHLIAFLRGSYEYIQGELGHEQPSFWNGVEHRFCDCNVTIYNGAISRQNGLPTKDSPHAKSPHHPLIVEGSL